MPPITYLLPLILCDFNLTLPLPHSPSNTDVHKVHLFMGALMHLSNFKERNIWTSKNPVSLDQIASVRHLNFCPRFSPGNHCISAAWFFLQLLVLLNWQYSSCFSQWLLNPVTLIFVPTWVSLFLYLFTILQLLFRPTHLPLKQLLACGCHLVRLKVDTINENK